MKQLPNEVPRFKKMQNPAEDEGTLQRRHSSRKQLKPHGSRSNKRQDSDPWIPGKWVPRVPAGGNLKLGPWTLLPSKELKIFDKENLPYFRIWKSLTL
ncbi:hypothetical protein F2Q70_00030008 [Brassica cretica]|uniref:Uncharacterized protein n=2 Tax=Brassica cretica TaxID=69181 RepID=A0A8S9GXI5_BRACR|nr:hypothetical protein F2Q70_00030008 [Brassica cretica]KAF2551115.1 hypothetical protein F2Q68_00034488 [Brassica cretica]KAF3486989.1 hypothetical protein F2Q69_00053276 [Brassica cretica]KAF3590657.1 hypothetical protein DY000_02022307 [Brassica cretica]